MNGEDDKSIRDQLQSDSSGGIFGNKDLVRSDTIIDEDRIVGRDEQLTRIIGNLRPVFRADGIPDMLLTGPSGTGKSLIIHAVCKQIVEICESHGETFGVLSVNCEGPDTADRAVYRLVKTAAEEIGVDPGVPQTGVSTDQKLERLYELIRRHYDGVIFISMRLIRLKGHIKTPSIIPSFINSPVPENSVTLTVLSHLLRSQTTLIS